MIYVIIDATGSIVTDKSGHAYAARQACELECYVKHGDGEQIAEFVKRVEERNDT